MINGKNPPLASILITLILALIALEHAVIASYSLNDQEGRIVVATTHPVISLLTRLIGGDYVDVVDAIPPGVDPHEYEPTIDVMRKISSSDVIIIDSLHHLPISDKIYGLYSDKSIVLLDKLLSAGWAPEKIPGTNVENLHEVFLDERALLLSIDIISQILVRVAESKGLSIADYISARSEMLRSMVERSFDQARRDAGDLGITVIALYSPVSYYLLRSMGINVSTILTPDPEVEPSPTSIQSLRSSAPRCLLVASDLEHVDVDRLSGSLGSLGIRVVSIEIASHKDPEDLLLLPLSILVKLTGCIEKGGETASNPEDHSTTYLLLLGIATLGLVIAIITLLLREKRRGWA